MLDTDDPLRRRLATIIEPVIASRAENHSAGASIGTITGTRPENQDRGLIVFADYPTVPRKTFVLGLVCDGIGGLASGDEAATLALSTFVSVLLRASSRPNHERLSTAISTANAAVYQTFGGRSGSTLSAIMVVEDTILGINAGDSRIYGQTHADQFEQLSQDDTMAAVLGKNADADFYKNQLLQYIGMGDGLDTTVFQKPRSAFKRLLVTTDGIHGLSSEAFMEVTKVPSSDQHLIYRLLSLNDALGGKDNGTALVIRPDILDDPPTPSQGLILRLVSSFGKLEIWIPLLAHGRAAGQLMFPPEVEGKDEQHHPDSSPPDDHEPIAPHDRSEEPDQNTAAAPKTQRKRRRRKPRGEKELPLDDVAPPLEVRVLKATD